MRRFNQPPKRILTKKSHYPTGLSVGVMAYNEEKDVIDVLEAINHQKIRPNVKISEILVISDGSTDKTDELVTKYSLIHPKVRLVRVDERAGKCHSINLFIQMAQNDIVVMANADNIPDKNCLQNLFDALKNPKVAIAGPRVICVNSKKSFVGRLSRILWRMHHRIALRKPKLCGFLVFRKKVIDHIQEGLILDESAMEYITQSKRYIVSYISEAVLYLKGPENLREHINQRKRNHVGYFIAKKITPAYQPSTFRFVEIFRAIYYEILYNPAEIFSLFFLIVLEALSKILATYEFFILGVTYKKWPMIESSKGVARDQRGFDDK